jgi:Ca-activated chloride channel family protein
VRIRYSKWTELSRTDDQRLEQLKSLFSYLLIQTSGDAEEAFEWLKQLAMEHGLFDASLGPDDLLQKLKDEGIIEEADDALILTAKGVQRIRRDALNEIFTSLRKGDVGAHEVPQTGKGVDRAGETRKWTSGDSAQNIDLSSTLKNTFKREGIEDFNLAEEDLEVYDTEHLTSCSTSATA